MDQDIQTALEQPNPRPHLARLAQVEFKRTKINYLKAFLGFRDSRNIAHIIAAKRANTFDYGVLIRDDEDTGATLLPPDFDAVIHALKQAAEGKYLEINLQGLGLGDLDVESREELRGHLCPLWDGVRPDGSEVEQDIPLPEVSEDDLPPEPTYQEPAKVEQPEVQVEAPLVEPVAVTEVEAAPAAPEEEEEVQIVLPSEGTLVLGDLGDIERRIDELSTDLGKALATHLDAVRAETLNSAGQLLGVLEAVVGTQHRHEAELASVRVDLHMVNENLRTVLTYLDPGAAADMPSLVGTVEAAPRQESVQDAYTVVSVNVEEAPEPEVESPVEVEEPVAEKPQKVEAAPPSAPTASSDEVDLLDIDLDSLDMMNMPELRDLAIAIEVPKAAQISFGTLLKSKIRKKVEAARKAASGK